MPLKAVPAYMKTAKKIDEVKDDDQVERINRQIQEVSPENKATQKKQ